ncbi:MAG: uracil-DNA glycosylase [Chloroflexi bacterium]|nr:MAG: uracil-DNA glycosylase [Chloroflexota bacterium]
MNRLKEMEAIAREVEQLEESPLYAYRVQNGFKAVIGEGRVDANILFIGEAPGEQEAKSGRPFVGASGRLLNELLGSTGLQREDVYITNVVKDRPPENRDPTPAEIALYAPFLVRQIEIIRPKVIATLGRFAMEFVLNLFEMPERGKKISQLHGQRLRAQAPHGEIAVVPLYHPAVALYTTAQRQTLADDFKTLKEFV